MGFIHVRWRAALLVALLCVLFASSAAPVRAQSFQGLGDLPGGDFFSTATAVSADGNVVVGTSISYSGDQPFEAFRWTRATGMVGLGDLPGGGVESQASGVSADGSVVVGFSRSTASGGYAEAYRLSTGQFFEAHHR